MAIGTSIADFQLLFLALGPEDKHSDNYQNDNSYNMNGIHNTTVLMYKVIASS